MLYLFTTKTTMKDYNSKKWWIDRDIISPKRIKAATLKEAINKFADYCEDEHSISISKTARRNAPAMYNDLPNGETRQCGYVFTGATEFQDDDRRIQVKQFIDLWTDIQVLQSPFEQTA